MLVLGFAVFNAAETAHAGGLGSFWSIFLGNQQASAETSALADVSDSQVSRAVVLRAAMNPLLAEAQVSTDTPPIDGGTALSEEIAKENSTIVQPVNTLISTYTVHSGDTISGVAKMFNVSVNTVLWANDLTGKSVLKPGETLVILPVTGITYTVKKGDTLQGIAARFKADVNDIVLYNDLTGTGLTAGDQIIIPSAEVSAPSSAASPSSSAGSSGSSTSWLACPVPGAWVSQGIHGHNGVDLAIPVGTPIRAAARGTVIISRSNGAWNGGYGNFVVILHPNGEQTLYAHMKRAVATPGEAVSQGEVIGYVGLTGLTTGPHLHFEVRGGVNPFWQPSRCR